MADVAIVFGFGHGDMCCMSLPELARWHARAHDRVDAGRDRAS